MFVTTGWAVARADQGGVSATASPVTQLEVGAGGQRQGRPQALEAVGLVGPDAGLQPARAGLDVVDVDRRSGRGPRRSTIGGSVGRQRRVAARAALRRTGDGPPTVPPGS